MNTGNPTPATPSTPLSEPAALDDALLITSQEEERVSVASNWTLVWWRFRKNKLAVFSAVLLIFLFTIVLAPDFFSTMDPETTDAKLAFIPIQRIHWFDEGKLRPWVPAVIGKRDPVTLRMVWTTDDTQKVYLRFFSAGYTYQLFGRFEANLHLVTALNPEDANRIHLLGTDRPKSW
jgi:peptide/nickel transport system permease protein